MAEFQEVMKQWRRFCRSHKHCGECEFDGSGICGEAHLTDIRFADVELRIMSWAAEHPEPVYPTWAEWLHSLCIAKFDASLEAQRLGNRYNETSKDVPGVWVLTPFARAHIPADIAEKLGIKPKEAE